jgi:hypothetical protein
MDNGMFVGTIERNVVYSSHPVIVVEGVTVVGSFRNTQEAEGFVRGSRKFSAHIFRHDGQEWVSHPFEQINPFLIPKRVRKPHLYN